MVVKKFKRQKKRRKLRKKKYKQQIDKVEILMDP